MRGSILSLLSVVLVTAAGRAEDAKKLNVLFIAVDDLKPVLGCYGDRTVKSPNIDRLAKQGLVFERAYCQQAVCSPSRTSLLLGRRPDTTKVYDLETHFRKNLPDAVTLPQDFKKNGYHTQAFGKIYHGGLDDAESWSVPHTGPKAPGFGPEGQKLLKQLREQAMKDGKDLTKRQNQPRGLPWEAPDLDDNKLADGSLADQAVAALEKIKDKPFFLAVGFLKPHLPFVAPKKYWDLYDPKQFKAPTDAKPAKDSPAHGWTNWGELRAYHNIPKTGPLSEEQARNMLHGYRACVSYTDAQVGRLLDALDRLKLRERTVVILWGDHGWHLGDHGQWCKHTNYEQATRAPLILSVPGQKSAGQKTSALVEFVDIYPTLVELCGRSAPPGLEGTSFKPLLDDPKRAWKSAAFSQYPRQVPGEGRAMGYAMRTDRYRFVEWRVPGKEFVAHELYDLKDDPGETVNLAKQPGNEKLVKELTEKLKGGWKAAQPSEPRP